MSQTLVLASGSQSRAQMLRAAGVEFEVKPARVDEHAVKDALTAEGVRPRDVADALAEMKSLKVSEKNPGTLVLGCDQILDFSGKIISKPESPNHLMDQMRELRGQKHILYSAAVLSEDGKPVWRHIGEARLTMRAFSEPFLIDYVDRNWDSIRHSVGGYLIEEEGSRLFSRVDGDAFTILGLPLIELLNYLTMRGVLQA